MNPFSFAASVNANNSSRTSSYVFSPNSLYFLSTASPSLRQSLSQFPSNNRFQTVRSDKSLLSFQSYLPSCSFLILPAFETYSFSYFYFFHFALQYKQIILLPDTIIKPSLSNSMKPQKISDFFCSLLYRRRIQK